MHSSILSLPCVIPLLVTILPVAYLLSVNAFRTPFTSHPFHSFHHHAHSVSTLTLQSNYFQKNNTLSAIVNLNRFIFHKAGHNWLTGEMITTENESTRAYPFPFPLRLSNPLSFAVIKVWSLKAGDISTAQVPQVQFPPQRSAYSLFTIDPTLNGNCSTLYSLQ